MNRFETVARALYAYLDGHVSWAQYQKVYVENMEAKT